MFLYRGSVFDHSGTWTANSPSIRSILSKLLLRQGSSYWMNAAKQVCGLTASACRARCGAEA